MMLTEQVDKDLVEAMKSQDALRLSVLRMMKSALKHKQVEGGKPLSDEQALAELAILESYLPAAATDQEMDAAVAEALAETGATTAKEIGKVIKVVMAKLAGKTVDGQQISEKVRARLMG